MYGVEWRQQYQDKEWDEALGLMDAVEQPDGPDEDLAVQSYKDDSDINVLMRRFGVTGQLPTANILPFYGDFSAATTYQEALNMVLQADQAFDSLPARIRNRFNNDPMQLIRFLENDQNRDEAAELGLTIPRQPEDPPIVSDDGGTPP